MLAGETLCGLTEQKQVYLLLGTFIWVIKLSGRSSDLECGLMKNKAPSDYKEHDGSNCFTIAFFIVLILKIALLKLLKFFY